MFNHVPYWCWHNARYMYYIYCAVVYPAHIFAVLWSAVSYAVLYAAQPS